MKTLIAILLMTSSFISTSAAAQLQERELRRELTHSQMICADLNCPEASIQAQAADFEQLPYPVRSSLLEIADHFVQVWGDTILEGDYLSSEQFVLDEVETLYHQGVPAGYRITYSADAWDTSTCPYDSERPESLDGCTEGRIVEKGVITLDGRSFFVDPTHYAEFQD
jgi:hypothetical protein